MRCTNVACLKCVRETFTLHREMSLKRPAGSNEVELVPLRKGRGKKLDTSRTFFCNWSLQPFSADGKQRCDLCHEDCTPYNSIPGGGIKHADGECDCAKHVGHGGSRVGAGRLRTELSPEDLAKEIQRRRVVHTEKKLESLKAKFKEQSEGLEQQLSDHKEKLEALRSGVTTDLAWPEEPLRQVDSSDFLQILGSMSLDKNSAGPLTVDEAVYVLDHDKATGFLNTWMTRTVQWAKYAGHPAASQLNLEDFLNLEGVPTNFEKVRCGCPNRELNKQTVFFAATWSNKLGRQEEVTGMQIANCLLNGLAFRGWHNDEKLYTNFLEAYGGDLTCEGFDKERFVKACLSAGGCSKKRRNGAYNVGSYGASSVKMEVPEDKLAARLEEVVIPLLLKQAEVLLNECWNGGNADHKTSMMFLCFLRLLIGPFVALQVALDTCMVLPALFNSELVIDAGPGAVATMTELYPGAGPRQEGMVRKRSFQQAAVPLCFHFAAYIRTSEDAPAAKLRALYATLALPLPTAADVEYWACEHRQVVDALAEGNFRKAAGTSEESYRMRMQSVFYKNFFTADLVFVEPVALQPALASVGGVAAAQPADDSSSGDSTPTSDLMMRDSECPTDD